VDNGAFFVLGKLFPDRPGAEASCNLAMQSYPAQIETNRNVFQTLMTMEPRDVPTPGSSEKTLVYGAFDSGDFQYFNVFDGTCSAAIRGVRKSAVASMRDSGRVCGDKHVFEMEYPLGTQTRIARP
jgi:hypothetical protein